MKINLSWIVIAGAGALALVLAVAFGAFQSTGPSPGAATAGGPGGTDGQGGATEIAIAPSEEEAGEPVAAPGADLQTSDDAAPGSEEPHTPVELTVWALLESRSAYDQREVILRGTILNLCVRGCQLTLDDGTASVPVELVGDALSRTIPLRSSGRQIWISGVFHATPRPHVKIEGPFDWRLE